MYDWPELRAETDAFWRLLRHQFQDAGFQPPGQLSRCEDEAEGWLSPNLFFSQTCGYPFATNLRGKVALLGTPHYDIEGWNGPKYSSALLVRSESTLDDIRHSRSMCFAFNGRNSLSGYRCLGPLFGNPEAWFAGTLESGGHRASANLVCDGLADIAAIDALCWHYYQRFEPERAAKLRVVSWTPPLPGLPYITNNCWNADELNALRRALAAAAKRAAFVPLTEKLNIVGATLLDEREYQSIKSL